MPPVSFSPMCHLKLFDRLYFLRVLLLWHFFLGRSWASADSYFGFWQRRHRLSTGRLLSFIHFFISWEMPPNTSQPFLPGGWGRWRAGRWKEGVSENSGGWARRLWGRRSGQTCYVELSRVFPHHQIVHLHWLTFSSAPAVIILGDECLYMWYLVYVQTNFYHICD